MLPTYEVYKAKASVDIKEKKESMRIVQPSSDPNSLALQIKEAKDKMSKYIEDNTDFVKNMSSKEIAKEKIRDQLDYLFNLPSVYHYAVNPDNSLNVAMWKAIVHILKPSIPANLRMQLK